MYYGLSLARQVKELAVFVCDVISHGANNKAVDLMVETCAAETLLGAARDGTVYYAGAGVSQVDEGTFIWLRDKYARHRVAISIKSQMNINLAKVSYNELDNSPLLALIFCRLRYLAVPAAIPDTIEGRAHYWKKWYNSTAGKGTPEEYLSRCEHSLSDIVTSDVIDAAAIIADTTALVTSNAALRYVVLSDEDRRDLINRLLANVENKDRITSPEALQAENVAHLIAQGWSLGEYDVAAKTSPYLCEFSELDAHMQAHIMCIYSVMDNLIFS